MIGIKIDPITKKTVAMFNTMKIRSNTFKDAVLYYAAQQVMDSMQESLGKTNVPKDYVKSLSIAKLFDADGKNILYSVSLKNTVNQVKNLDPEITVIRIKAIQRLGGKDPKAAILERFSPWTIETIPFFPDKKFAEVINNKATKKEVDAVKSLRKKDESIWRRELLKAGAKLESNLNQKTIPTNLKSTNDVELDAIRLEFGLDGNNNGRQWAKAMRELASSGIASIIKDNGLMKILSDPNFTNFSTYVPKVTKRMTAAEARNLVTFQKRIGLIQ